ncbi:MAG: OmpA family protein [Pseudomonadota bacterium]
MNKKQIALAVSVGAISMLPGCAFMEKHGGKVVGAAGGIVIGALACEGDPACMAVGALGGLLLGELYDRRQAELREIAEKNNISLETKTVKTYNSDKENGLELSINEGGMFEVGSAELKTKARLDLMTVATVYRNKPQKILVMGHTDATGNDDYNQSLSERRARTVAKLFEEVGVPTDQIYFQGAGESQPVATNDTTTGRAINRRVEIIEVDSEQSLAAYNLQRQNNRAYLSHSNRTSQEKTEVLKRVSKAPMASNEPAVVSKKAQSEPARTKPSVGSGQPPVVDFGGSPATSDFGAILQATGQPQSNDSGIGFSLFNKAVASETAELSPCFLDGPRKVGDIQNLASGKKLDIGNREMAAYWPGLNGNVWMDTVNGHMVAVQDLYIIRETGTPQGSPTVSVYQDVSRDQVADYTEKPHVEAYPGESGLLVRAYFSDSRALQCMDIVMGNTSLTSAKAGKLYYAAGDNLLEQNIRLERLK